MAALFCGAAWGQAPSYSAANIVNVSDYSAGPFAPNSVLSLFGTNLSYSDPVTVSQASMNGDYLPVQLGGVEVMVDNQPAPLLYVAAGQINFLVPSTEIPGTSTVQVFRQGLYGPAVQITLVNAAPALFPHPDYAGYAIAQDWNNASALATPDAPAHAYDTIVLYLTGLGQTQPNYDPGEIPTTMTNLANAATLQVLLNGTAIDSSVVKYAGVTPGSGGLYQINFVLPDGLAPDPEIRISLAGQCSAAGLKLAVRKQ